MTRFFLLKLLVLMFVQIILGLTGVILFFKGIPLINCLVINTDTKFLNQFEKVTIPEDAKCYFINHGDISFLNNMPFEQEIWPFIYLMLAAIISMIIVVILKLCYYETYLKNTSVLFKFYMLMTGAILGSISIIMLNFVVTGNFSNFSQILIGTFFGTFLSLPIGKIIKWK